MNRLPIVIRRAVLCAVLATSMVCALAAPSALAAGSVVFTPSSGQLKFTGGTESSNLGVTYSGFSYTFEDSNADITGTADCPTVTASKVTCAVGPNAVHTVWLEMGAGVDETGFDASIPAYVTAKVRQAAGTSSPVAPLEAYITDPVDPGSGTVFASSTHDYIEITSSGWGGEITGNSGDDQIIASVPYTSGVSTLQTNGGPGDDLIDASASAAWFEYTSSPGRDTFIGGSGSDTIRFGEGEDALYGGPGSDRFYDNGGNDPAKIWGGPATTPSRTSTPPPAISFITRADRESTRSHTTLEMGSFQSRSPSMTTLPTMALRPTPTTFIHRWRTSVPIRSTSTSYSSTATTTSAARMAATAFGARTETTS